MESPNLNYIKKLSGNDPDFEEKLVGIIKLEFPDECLSFRDNFDKKNYKAASQNVHKLKHKISILGLEKSYVVAEKFENNLLEGNAKLQNEFESILNTITKFLQQL